MKNRKTMFIPATKEIFVLFSQQKNERR